MNVIAQVSRYFGLAWREGVARRTVYVYQAPVRIWHWVNALAMVVLFVTGYLIATPPASVDGRSQRAFPDGLYPLRPFRRRTDHGGLFLLRIYWAFVGNKHASQIFYVPFWRGDFWKGVIARNPLVRLSGKISQAICRA